MTIDVDTRPLRRWLTAATRPTAVLVACREHDGVDAWRAPRNDAPHVIYRLAGCLADIPPAALLEILAAGASSVAGLLDGCTRPVAASDALGEAARIANAISADQPVRSLRQPSERERDPVPTVLARKRGSRRRTPRPAPVPLLDALAMPVSRRALVGAGSPLAPLDPHPGLRLHAAVRELVGEAPLPSGLDESPTGAALLAAPGCGGTGVCVRACPSEALTLTLTELTTGEASQAGIQQFELAVDPGRCLDCGLCVELCPESGITRVGPLPWSEALEGGQRTLRVGLVRRCSRCGTPHRTEGQLCDVCTFRTAQPFGSQLPAGFVRKPRP